MGLHSCCPSCSNTRSSSPPQKKKLAESGWRFRAPLSCCLTYLSSHVQSEWLFADGMLFI